MSIHEPTIEHGHRLGPETYWIRCKCGWVGFAAASERLALEHYDDHVSPPGISRGAR